MIIKIYFAHKLPQSYLPKLSEILISTTLFLTTSVNGIVTFDSTFTFTPADAPAELDVYSAVARVCDANGDNTSGSATYIRDNYLLTANSVADRTHVTFDGFTFYERDLEFEAKQIVVNGQNVDLKVIKLLEKPFGFETPMNSVRIDDTNVAVAYDDVFVAGWGVGNDPNTNVFLLPIFPRIWPWGGIDTIDKRWAFNGVDRAEVFVEQGYEYDALVTDLATAGFQDGGIARFDQGGGIFSKINDEWQLIGITTQTTQISGANTSTFSVDTTVASDSNYFVRISSYIDEIEAAMTESLTFADWAVAQGLVGADALDMADTDGDGIVQLLEFALGGNPNQSDIETYPTSQLVKEGDKSYLEITLLRPQGLANTTYSPEVSLDLSNWADPSAFDPAIPVTVADPVVVGEGIEAVLYRVEVTQDERLFIRLRVTVAS